MFYFFPLWNKRLVYPKQMFIMYCMTEFLVAARTVVNINWTSNEQGRNFISRNSSSETETKILWTALLSMGEKGNTEKFHNKKQQQQKTDTSRIQNNIKKFPSPPVPSLSPLPLSPLPPPQKIISTEFILRLRE